MPWLPIGKREQYILGAGGVRLKEMKTTLVIFGITGDLATRKLLPALESLLLDDALDITVVGVSRRAVNLDELMGSYPNLKRRSEMVTMNLAHQADYEKLAKRLKDLKPDQILHYLSVPPSAAADITDFLGAAGLNTKDNRILFEKPFGFDLASAQEFIAQTARFFDDGQLYRIDHYMAKEVAMGILRIRRQATDPDLKKKIKSVTIVASEKIGIEGRAQFYEQTGALRDFVQGHLMQLLALVLIRNPTDEPLPVQRLNALQKIQPLHPQNAVRAQYEGYQGDADNPGSQVETFVSLKLESSDPEWKNVDIRLVTGKALSEKRTSIEFIYEDGSRRILDEDELLNSSEDHHFDAYERVLLEAIEGRREIFTSGPEVIRSWEILAPLQQTWMMDDAPLLTYKQGAELAAIKV